MPDDYMRQLSQFPLINDTVFSDILDIQYACKSSSKHLSAMFTHYHHHTIHSQINSTAASIIIPKILELPGSRTWRSLAWSSTL